MDDKIKEVMGLVEAYGNQLAYDDFDHCPHCDGTGEGRHEGQICPACKGKGY